MSGTDVSGHWHLLRRSLCAADRRARSSSAASVYWPPGWRSHLAQSGCWDPFPTEIISG